MKKIIVWVLVVCLLLAGCRKAEPIIEETVAAWLEQFDLGVRYLQEDNYEAAILAFTAVIEIDDKNVDAYLYRAESYVKAADVLAEEDPEENKNKVHDYLDKAEADYDRVIELAPEREEEINRELEEIRERDEAYTEEPETPEQQQGEDLLLGTWKASAEYEGMTYFNEITFFEDGTVRTMDYDSSLYELLEWGAGYDPFMSDGTWNLVEQTENVYLIDLELVCDVEHLWGEMDENGNITQTSNAHVVIRMEINGNSAQLDHHSGDTFVLYHEYPYERQEMDLWSWLEAYRAAET